MNELEAGFVEKLWNTVFGSGIEGMAPAWGQALDKHNRQQQRQTEWQKIRDIETELKALYAGRKVIRDGKLREVEQDDIGDDVLMNPLIEQVGVDDSRIQVAPDIVSLLQMVKREEGLRTLARILNVRKCVLLAEETGCDLLLDQVTERAVQVDWLARWRDGAQDAYSADVQAFWARMLAMEVIRPGRFSIRAIEFLRNVSAQDVEMLGLASRLNIQGFIYDHPGQYFSEMVHEPMLALMQELGLLKAREHSRVELTSQSPRQFRCVLRCGNKALFVEADRPGSPPEPVVLPAYALTLLGEEILSLCQPVADTAYLWAVGGELKKQGLKVSVGDWVSSGDKTGLYSEKMTL